MIKLLLLLFAVAVFVCIAFDVINGTYTFRWEAGAFAAWGATFIPFPDIAMPTRPVA